jgi:outer membrane protein TolC
MKQTIMLFFTFSLTLFGMSYAKFKEHTLKYSKVLQSQKLSLQVTQEENNILLRTPNPTLSLEASRFNENNIGNNSFGYSVSATQSIRTNSYMSGIKEKTYASTLLSKAYITDGKAKYLKTLESLYTSYVYQNKMLILLQKEYELSKEVTNMVKVRFLKGSDNKVSYLQAKTETLTLKTLMYTTKEQINELYFQLLSIAGFRKKISLEKRFIYSISSKTKKTSKLSPKQKIGKAKVEIYKSDLSMNRSSFQNYDLYTGIEKEPEQSILRFGINIPISIHHDKSQERMLAKLQKQQTKLDNEQLSLNIYSQKQMLKESIRELSDQYYALKSLQKEQQELASLLQEGYQIAKGSLFEMMLAKNKLIQTKKALLQTQKIINNKKIELIFLQGGYND